MAADLVRSGKGDGMKVGFIGLGKMGEPMARNLLAAGHQLTVYNRTRSRAAGLEQAGARVVDEPSGVCDGDVVITMLADDAALEETTLGSGGVLARLAPGAIHVSMSTISVELSRRLMEAHSARDQLYVSAPVMGRPDAAAARHLFVLTAGPQQAVARCQPLFDAIGQRTFPLGEEATAANVAKLAMNFLIVSAVESMGEAFALVRKSGMRPEKFYEVFTETLFGALIYRNYGNLIMQGKYKPAGFQLSLGLKDVRLMLSAGEGAEVPLPLASMARDRFLTAIARGYREHDWAALALIAAEDAGL
jgi:3-hydroxyisobutyrate dehydrogenase-like beta-hydroxyacid dehydrogenase